MGASTQRNVDVAEADDSLSAPAILNLSPAATLDDDDRHVVPHLREIKEFFRQLAICEKNLSLYPTYSKVVRESTSKLYAAARTCLDVTGGLRVQIRSDRFLVEEEPVYVEEKAKGLAFQIHQDGVREVSFLEDVTRDELEALLLTIKDSRDVDGEEDDFITLFWEKDLTHILVQLADDCVLEDDLPEVPRRTMAMRSVERFQIPEAESRRLEEVMSARRAAEDEGDSTFEITEEEATAIREMIEAEASYFPITDFVDILLELLARDPSPEGFEKTVSMLRTIVASLIEDRNFARAADLFRKLGTNEHPGLTTQHRRQIREMLETFTDKRTVRILEEYLEEHEALAEDDPIFLLMREYPRQALDDFCGFLRFHQHLSQLSKVLVQLGTGNASTLAKHLENPDPLVVRSVIGILLKTDDDSSMEYVARALQHPDESVRLHAAKMIIENGDASVGSLFIPLLGESSVELLNLALQFFARHSCPDAFANLEKLISSRRFKTIDQKRQMLCFTALLKTSYTKAFAYIKNKILRWRFSLSQTSRARKCSAILSLATVEADQVRELLEDLASSKRSALAPAARRALRSLEIRAEKLSEPASAGRRSRPRAPGHPRPKREPAASHSSVDTQSSHAADSSVDPGESDDVAVRQVTSVATTE